MIFNKFISFGLLSISSVIFISCGGGEEEVVNAKDNSAGNTNEETLPSVDTKTETEAVSEQVPEEEVEETQVVPNPNGVYLPTGEERNGQPVYENQEGFSMWFDGSVWKITDKTGGGKVISQGKASINDNWQNGAKASFYPDEEYAKDATFRLAVAFQGSQDNKNAIRLFEQFVMDYPNDKLAAEVYLSLGDLAISEVSPDEQPSYDQITNARRNYGKVRQNTENIGLISDATFNEGGLLERVAENPEGLVNYYYKFDKNEDEVLQLSEFNTAELNASNPFQHYDLNSDKSLDYGELFEFASFETFTEIEKLYRNYQETYSSQEGARISQATEKIGFACEELGRPSEMLKMYYENIETYGNDPSNAGVDNLLEKYTKKYSKYDILYGNTLRLLKLLSSPKSMVSFSYINRAGIEETHEGTLEEIFSDRKKLLPFLNTEFPGIDNEVMTELVKSRTAAFTSDSHKAKFKGYLDRYQKYSDNFPNEISPEKVFSKLLQDAIASNKKPLELRMRFILDITGSSGVAGSYNPQSSDFPAASPGVLVWMAEKMISQNSISDAVGAMERLIENYGDAGGDFLFDANYLIGQAKEKEKDFQTAAFHYENALSNSSWHDNANDARMRLGNALFEAAKSTKQDELYKKAESAFQEVRNGEGAGIEVKAESSFMMGECRKELKDWGGAGFYYLETTLSFPSAQKWVPKSFEQAIRCYEQAGLVDQVSGIEKQYADWQRNYLD
jgi:TolA-binding protein